MQDPISRAEKLFINSSACTRMPALLIASRGSGKITLTRGIHRFSMCSILRDTSSSQRNKKFQIIKSVPLMCCDGLDENIFPRLNNYDKIGVYKLCDGI